MAYSQILSQGATSQFLEVEIRNSTTGQGITGITAASVLCSYMIEGSSASVAVTPVTGTLGTYSSGAWVEVNSTSMPGLYQFSIPNAALASGNAVTLMFLYTGALNAVYRIVLISANLRDAAYLGLSSLGRLSALAGDNQGIRNVTNDVNGNPVSYDICGYDNATDAATNDGATGLIYKNTISNTYDSYGRLITSVATRVV